MIVVIYDRNMFIMQATSLGLSNFLQVNTFTLFAIITYLKNKLERWSIVYLSTLSKDAYKAKPIKDPFQKHLVSFAS
jgi:hypothetical protein